MDEICMHIVKDNFGIKAEKIQLLVNHSGSVTYLVSAKYGKYVLKRTGHNGHGESGGLLAEYLHSNGIKVAKFFQTTDGKYAFYDEHYQYTLQEFIHGQQLQLNTAPDWFMSKYVQTLGQIQNVLKDYKLPPAAYYNWPKWLTSKQPMEDHEKAIGEKITKARKTGDFSLVAALNRRLQHIRRVAAFDIDPGKLTHVNSHGDYYINQVIVRDGELFVIDWDSGGHAPACFEVMIAFTYADPVCKTGVIDIARYWPFLREFLKYTALSGYDIKMMPYFAYRYSCFCQFTPPYNSLSDDYLQIAMLSDTLMDWLYDNVDILSAQLVEKNENEENRQ